MFDSTLFAELWGGQAGFSRASATHLQLCFLGLHSDVGSPLPLNMAVFPEVLSKSKYVKVS